MHKGHEHDREPDVSQGYEARDVNPRPVWWFTIGLLALTVGVMVLLVGMHRFLEGQYGSSTYPPAEERTVPDGPVLQANPRVQLDALREQEQETLTNYGWVDEEQGIVRIPIERAMELVAEHGAPFGPPEHADEAGAQNPGNGETAATVSGSSASEGY